MANESSSSVWDEACSSVNITAALSSVASAISELNTNNPPPASLYNSLVSGGFVNLVAKIFGQAPDSVGINCWMDDLDYCLRDGGGARSEAAQELCNILAAPPNSDTDPDRISALTRSLLLSMSQNRYSLPVHLLPASTQRFLETIRYNLSSVSMVDSSVDPFLATCLQRSSGVANLLSSSTARISRSLHNSANGLQLRNREYVIASFLNFLVNRTRARIPSSVPPSPTPLSQQTITSILGTRPYMNVLFDYIDAFIPMHVPYGTSSTESDFFLSGVISYWLLNTSTAVESTYPVWKEEEENSRFFLTQSTTTRASLSNGSQESSSILSPDRRVHFAGAHPAGGDSHNSPSYTPATSMSASRRSFRVSEQVSNQSRSILSSSSSLGASGRQFTHPIRQGVLSDSVSNSNYSTPAIMSSPRGTEVASTPSNRFLSPVRGINTPNAPSLAPTDDTLQALFLVVTLQLCDMYHYEVVNGSVASHSGGPKLLDIANELLSNSGGSGTSASSHGNVVLNGSQNLFSLTTIRQTLNNVRASNAIKYPAKAGTVPQNRINYAGIRPSGENNQNPNSLTNVKGLLGKEKDINDGVGSGNVGGTPPLKTLPFIRNAEIPYVWSRFQGPLLQFLLNSIWSADLSSSQGISSFVNLVDFWLLIITPWRARDRHKSHDLTSKYSRAGNLPVVRMTEQLVSHLVNASSPSSSISSANSTEQEGFDKSTAAVSLPYAAIFSTLLASPLFRAQVTSNEDFSSVRKGVGRIATNYGVSNDYNDWAQWVPMHAFFYVTVLHAVLHRLYGVLSGAPNSNPSSSRHTGGAVDAVPGTFIGGRVTSGHQILPLLRLLERVLDVFEPCVMDTLTFVMSQLDALMEGVSTSNATSTNGQTAQFSALARVGLGPNSLTNAELSCRLALLAHVRLVEPFFQNLSALAVPLAALRLKASGVTALLISFSSCEEFLRSRPYFFEIPRGSALTLRGRTSRPLQPLPHDVLLDTDILMRAKSSVLDKDRVLSDSLGTQRNNVSSGNEPSSSVDRLLVEEEAKGYLSALPVVQTAKRSSAAVTIQQHLRQFFYILVSLLIAFSALSVKAAALFGYPAGDTTEVDLNSNQPFLLKLKKVSSWDYSKSVDVSSAMSHRLMTFLLFLWRPFELLSTFFGLSTPSSTPHRGPFVPAPSNLALTELDLSGIRSCNRVIERSIFSGDISAPQHGGKHSLISTCESVYYVALRLARTLDLPAPTTAPLFLEVRTPISSVPAFQAMPHARRQDPSAGPSSNAIEAENIRMGSSDRSRKLERFRKSYLFQFLVFCKLAHDPDVANALSLDNRSSSTLSSSQNNEENGVFSMRKRRYEHPFISDSAAVYRNVINTWESPHLVTATQALSNVLIKVILYLESFVLKDSFFEIFEGLNFLRAFADLRTLFYSAFLFYCWLKVSFNLAFVLFLSMFIAAKLVK